jgi:hypothetical protein
VIETPFAYLGEKDRTNMWLARALVGTTQISTEILTVQCPVTPKCAGASRLKINDDDVSMLKQACSGRYSGSLKLSSWKFERAQNRSTPFLTLFSIALEINCLGRYHTCGNTRENWYKNPAHTRSFLPGYSYMYS